MNPQALQAAALADGWEVREIYRAGVLAGFFVVRDNEVHAWRNPEFSGRWLTRQDVERITAPLLAAHGHVVTSVRIRNRTGHRFVRRLGFVCVGRTVSLALYRAERLNHARD